MVGNKRARHFRTGDAIKRITMLHLTPSSPRCHPTCLDPHGVSKLHTCSATTGHRYEYLLYHHADRSSRQNNNVITQQRCAFNSNLMKTRINFDSAKYARYKMTRRHCSNARRKLTNVYVRRKTASTSVTNKIRCNNNNRKTEAVACIWWLAVQNIFTFVVTSQHSHAQMTNETRRWSSTHRSMPAGCDRLDKKKKIHSVVCFRVRRTSFRTHEFLRTLKWRFARQWDFHTTAVSGAISNVRADKPQHRLCRRKTCRSRARTKRVLSHLLLGQVNKRAERSRPETAHDRRRHSQDHTIHVRCAVFW